MEHSFNTQIAQKLGIEEAIIVKFLFHWIKKNAANSKHYHDGRWWTYNSAQAFSVLFPYMNKAKVHRVLKSLCDQDIIIKGNYNSSPWDKTSWYAFSDNGFSLLRDCNIDISDVTNLQHRCNESETAIPINIPIINTNKERSSKERKATRFSPPTIQDIQEYISENNYNVDAVRFFDFYETKGWMVGKNKMKDWRAAVRTWVHKENEYADNRQDIRSKRRGTEVNIDSTEGYTDKL